MIKGKVVVTRPDHWLRYMPVGETRYLHPLEVTITQKALFFPFDAITESSIERNKENPYIIVTRIGSGNTCDDFEFDFIEFKKEDEYCLVLQTHRAYEELFDDPDFLMVPITDDQLEILDDEGFVPKEVSLEDLEKDLKIAERENNFERAIEIRNEIIKRKS